MMTQAIDKLLADSCGQVRPISLHVCNLHTRKVNKVVVSKPYLIIGRNAGCDLILSHESVTKQHAYLQVLDGRLFCIDQASRTGVFWKDHPRLYGWLDQGEWIQIGPYRITLEQPVGDDHPAAEGRRNTSPFLTRYDVDQGFLARLTVGDAVELPLSSQVSIIGRSKYCNLELDDEDVSRFHASVIKTADGNCWLIDLNSRTGVKVNHLQCQTALLSDNDLISVGPYLLTFHQVEAEVVQENSVHEEPLLEMLTDQSDAFNDDDSDETSLPTLAELELPAKMEPVQATETSSDSTLAQPTSECVDEKPAPLNIKTVPENDSLTDLPVPAVRQRKSELVVKKPAPIQKITNTRVPVPQASLVKAKQTALVSPPIARKNSDLASVQHRAEWLEASESHVLSQMMMQMKQMQQDMYDQMRLNMEMMAEFMGSMQKQQMQMIREELAELGKINLELMQLKQSLVTSSAKDQEVAKVQIQHSLSEAPSHNTKTDMTPAPTRVFKQKSSTPVVEPSQQQEESSCTSHTWISKRISMLENERTSRWEKMKAALMGK